MCDEHGDDHPVTSGPARSRPCLAPILAPRRSDARPKSTDRSEQRKNTATSRIGAMNCVSRESVNVSFDWSCRSNAPARRAGQTEPGDSDPHLARLLQCELSGGASPSVEADTAPAESAVIVRVAPGMDRIPGRRGTRRSTRRSSVGRRGVRTSSRATSRASTYLGWNEEALEAPANRPTPAVMVIGIFEDLRATHTEIEQLEVALAGPVARASRATPRVVRLPGVPPKNPVRCEYARDCPVEHTGARR
jgi:hypothetical protein